jgi:hypothetical protein
MINKSNKTTRMSSTTYNPDKLPLEFTSKKTITRGKASANNKALKPEGAKFNFSIMLV